MSAELLMSTSLAQRAQLTQPGSSSLMDRVRFDMAVAAADYSYRVGARQEQLRVYELASEKLEKETKSIKESVHADLDTGYFGPAPSSSGANSGSGASNFQRVGKTSTSAENPRN